MVGPIEAARLRNRAEVDRRSRSFALIHSGVVALGDAVVLLPGEAESGKSTLVAGLVRAGWAYISDELASIDPATGLVHPYTRPISIDVGAYSVFPELAAAYGADAEQWHVDPDHLRSGAAVDRPVRPTHVVFNRYVSDEPTELAELAGVEVVRRLLENSVRLATIGSTGFDVIVDTALSVQAAELTSGNLAEQIEAVSQFVSTTSSSRSSTRSDDTSTSTVAESASNASASTGTISASEPGISNTCHTAVPIASSVTTPSVEGTYKIISPSSSRNSTSEQRLQVASSPVRSVSVPSTATVRTVANGATASHGHLSAGQAL